jgi:hypothetical protein
VLSSLSFDRRHYGGGLKPNPDLGSRHRESNPCSAVFADESILFDWIQERRMFSKYISVPHERANYINVAHVDSDLSD